MSCVRFPQDKSPCWAPGRVGSIGAEAKNIIMATQKKAKLQDKNHQEGKRPLSDSESETEPSTYSTFSIHFPTFIVIESKDPSHPVTKLSPFVVEKQLHSILGTAKSVRKLKNNTILVECFTRQQSENLLKHKKFFQLDVNIYPHKTLNFSKGVVRCKELSLCSISEIEKGLKTQGVTGVTRISVKRNGEMRTTNTYILTFSSSVLPQSIKVGYISVKVEMYIPNPLRCFKCQQYGHHISKCPGNLICAKCGSTEENHDFEKCKSPLKCNNCKGDHAAFSRDCPIWKEEKEILHTKYTKNLSFPEARQLVKQRRADQAKFSFSTSYAGVAAPLKEECHTCVILAKLILKKFPEMVNDLKDILPKSTLSALTPEKSSAPSDKPSTSAQQKSPTTSSSSVSKPPSSTSKSNMSKPSKPNQDTPRTRSQPKTRVQLGKEGLPSASTYNKSRKPDDEEIFETRVSDSEVSQLVDSEKSLQGKKKNRKTRERKITVKIGQPSISLSNKFEKLEDSTDETCPEEDKMEEKMEEEQSDGSDCESPWARHRPEWDKNLDSWQTSTAETKCVEKTHM